VRNAALIASLLALSTGTPLSAQIYTRTSSNGVVEATNVPETNDYRLTYPGKGTLIHSRGFRGAYTGEYDVHISAAASMHGVAIDLIKAVIQVESEFDRYAVSSKGAQGLMQLMPFTARRFGVSDAFDPRQNIFAGVQYLRILLDMFQGDAALALAGYNAGENAVLRYHGIPPYKETQGYVKKIQGLLSTGFRAVMRTSTPLAPTPSAQALSFSPAVLRSSRGGGGPSAKVVPAKPRVYYRYTDERGTLHLAQDPPDEGVFYSLVRALDR